jgi:hypothetical protein
MNQIETPLETPLNPEMEERARLEEKILEPEAKWHLISHENPAPRDFTQYDTYRPALWKKIEAARENPFPNSHAPENPDMPTDEDGFDARIHHKPYLAKLNQYQFLAPDSERHFFGGSSNIGYKLRLNIAIADIEKVSNYLKEKGFDHKYLSGADSSGEVFTVYTGSRDRTDAIAKILSSDLDNALRKPVGEKELEFAPNVIGYFCTLSNPLGMIKEPGIEFSRYPRRNVRGIPLVRPHADTTRDSIPDDRVFDISYNFLSRVFGSYFYGAGTKLDGEQTKENNGQTVKKPDTAFDRLLRESLAKNKKS